VVLANAVLELKILVTWQFFGGQSFSALVVSRARKFDGGGVRGTPSRTAIDKSV
jgi:hypothetical protein